ncbi:hypothetical protein OG216_47825 (plasmid) [Streptomycetaceae bacterium NBC_01309]
MWKRARHAAPERAWADEAVRGLGQFSSQDELLAAVSRAVGQDLVVVPTDEAVLNGALEPWPGGRLAIRVPTAASGMHARHLVCRGAARALYNSHPTAPHDRMDYTQPIEREIEWAATHMSQTLDCAAAPRCF